MVGIKRRELFMYLSVIMYCVALFLKRVNLPIDEGICNKAMTLAAVIAVANIFFDCKMGIHQILLSALIGGLLFLDSIPNGNHEIFYLFLIIWGCRNVSSKNVMKLIFGIAFSATVLVGILTFVGGIENELFILNGNRKRYGLGYNSWTILPFQFLSLSMMLLYFIKAKIKLWLAVVLIGLGIWISILTDVRSACPFIVAGVLALYVAEYIEIKKWKRLKFLVFIPEVLAVASFVIVHLYSKGGHSLARINEILNNRLLYPAIGMEKYGIRFLSNPEVSMNGNSDSYFVLDNSYMNLLLVWGIVGATVVVIMCSYLIYYCIKKEDLKLLIILMLSLIVGLMWSRLLVLIEMEFLICYSDAFMTPAKRKHVMSLDSLKN